MSIHIFGKIDHAFSLKHHDFVQLVHLAQSVMQICSTFDPAQNADSHFWKIDHDFSLKHPDFLKLVHLAQYVM